MKRFLRFVWIAAILCFMLGGCFDGKQQYTIDLIVKGTETEFWQSVYDGAKAAAAAYHADVCMFGPAAEKDYRQQVQTIEESISRKPDSIILASADYNLMAEPMEQAVAAGIPVVIVDSAVASDQWVSFISTDNYSAGKILAEELIARADQPGTVGVVSFVKNSYPSVEREKGFRDFMQEQSDYLPLDTVYCYSNIASAQLLTEQIIRQNPNITAIVGLNAQSATGAARALYKLNRPDVFLAGIDCTVEEAAFMEEGVLDVAVVQNPYLMGYFSVETAVKHLSGEHVNSYILTDTGVVDVENLFSEKNQQLIFPFY